MKLRNKKTGEIKEVIVGGYPVSGKTKMWECSEMDSNEETGYKSLGTYTSLAELNEDWEDYEEPKEYWHIDFDGGLMQTSDIKCDKYVFDKLKEIGNYFETKEDAEKALEKLKAWKRLKDSGISFEAKVIDGRWCLGPKAEPKPRTSKEIHDLFKDIMFVFGGNDESSN